MSIYNVAVWVITVIIQSIVVFAASTTLFDAVHLLLHQLAKSKFRIARKIAAMHQVHHRFLDRKMRINRRLKRENFLFHIIPEYIVSILGTVIFTYVFDLASVMVVLGYHTWVFVKHIINGGLDENHMEMEKLDGLRQKVIVDQSYHAMHHIVPSGYYSSFLNIFDILFGTALPINRRKFTIIGGYGALGTAFKNYISKRGGTVDLIGRDNHQAIDYTGTDILILASGSRTKGEEFAANLEIPVMIGEKYIEANRERLVRPEIWGVGSEAEIHSNDGYAQSKRAFARYASHNWARSREVTYRHIVPASFTSKLGPGLWSANSVVAVAMFFISRGVNYVPVTYTGLALLNWPVFWLRGRSAVEARKISEA